MSIEKALADLTEAVKANTEVQAKIVELAEAAKNRGAETAPKQAAPKKTTRAAAAKKAEPKAEEEPKADDSDEPEAKPAPTKTTRSKKPKTPEVRVGISVDDLRDLARKHASNDGGDKEERERLKGLMAAAFDHLGVSKLSDMDDEERGKFAHYLDYWIEDNKQTLDFEALDEAVMAAIEANKGRDDEDDMLD